MDEWNLNELLYFNRNFFNNFNKLFDYDFNWLDDLLFDKLFSYNFNLADFYLFDDYLHNFLNDLRHFNDPLYSPYNRNNLFDYPINWFVNRFDMIVNFKSFAILYNRNCLLYDLFDNFNFWNFYYPLNNLFLYYRNLYYFLNNSFDWNDLLFDDLYLFRFLLDMINNSLYLNYLLDLYNFFHNCWNFNYFWHLLIYINDLLNNSRYFDNLVNNLFDWNNFFNDLLLNNWDLQRNIDYLLDLNDLLNFHNFLNLFCYWDHHRNLHSLLHDLLYNFLHFNNLRYRTVYFQNIIHIYHSHNLCS